MIHVPGDRAFVPLPQVAANSAKESGKKEEMATVRRDVGTPAQNFTKGPEFDSQAIAVRMAAMAMDAKEKELSFEEIIQKVLDETKLVNPQAAMEEADRKTQEDIETELDRIKKNKDLMEEAEGWETFAGLLMEELNDEQVEKFLGAIKESVKDLAKEDSGE